MPEIDNLEVQVLRNGVDILFASITLNRDGNHLVPSWQITLPHPILLNASDTWTIKRGLTGAIDIVINEEFASAVNFEDGLRTYTRTISGTGTNSADSPSNDLLTRCIPKTIVFVDQEWLELVSPGATIKDSILWTRLDFVGMSTAPQLYRLYHPRLPGREIDNDQFECYVGNWSHVDVARWLAAKSGLNFYSNLPDTLRVQATYTVQSGTTIYDAIKGPLQIWQPSFILDGDTFYALDVLSDTNDIPDIQTMVLGNNAIGTVTEANNYRDAQKRIDHIIVTGRKLRNTLSVPTPDESLTQSFTIDEVQDVYLIPNSVRTYPMTFGGVHFDQYKRPDCYQGPWESGDDQFTAQGIGKVLITEKDYVDSSRNIKKRVSETVDTYRDDGVPVHRLHKTYFYGPDLQATGNLEMEWANARLPAETNPALRLVKIHGVAHFNWIKELKRSLTKEFIEELVLYDVTAEGDKLSPIPLLTGMRSDYTRTLVEKEKDTFQAVSWARTHEIFEKLDRDDRGLLEVKKFDFDRIAGVVKLIPQTLQNPNRAQTSSSDELFRREYFREGAGQVVGSWGLCWKAPTTVNHENICTDLVAEQLRDRYFARGQNDKKMLSVKLLVPVPLRALNFLVRLPDVNYTVDDVPVTISGGDYVMKSDSERIEFQKGGKLNYDRTLTLKDGF